MDAIEALRLLCTSTEAHLGTYETECLRSKPRQSTLNQLEDVLKQTFIPAGAAIKSEWDRVRPPPRVNELIRFMLNGDSGEEALARFFLRNRYRQTSPEVRITMECPERGPTVIRLFSDRAKAIHSANGRTSLFSEQHEPIVTTRGGWIVRNVVSGKFFDAGGEISNAVAKQLQGEAS